MQALLVLTFLVVAAVMLRQKTSKKTSEKADASTYPLMRNNLFKLKASDIKLSNWDPEKPFCVVMETGYPEVTVTFLAAADGSTSIYLSNGGGFIGAGEFASIGAAAKAFIQQSAVFLKQAQKVTDHPLPGPGQVTFYFKTPDALYSFSDSEAILGENKSPLSVLFYGAQTIIGYIRQMDMWKKQRDQDGNSVSAKDAVMNADFVAFIRANRKKKMGEVLAKVAPMLMKSEMVFPKVKVEEDSEGAKTVRFLTKKDDEGNDWFQGYSNIQEFLQIFPPGSPYIVMKFSDFFKAIKSRPQVGGIAINSGLKDTAFMIPEPLFSYFKC